jgi:hypothetical protein
VVPTKLGAKIMNIGTPQNDVETTYIAFGLVDSLMDVLQTKGLITADDIDGIVHSVAVRLSQGNNSEQRRASEFLAQWLLKKPQFE